MLHVAGDEKAQAKGCDNEKICLGEAK